MNVQIKIGIVGLLIQFLSFTQIECTQIPDSVLLIAKRYMRYYSSFPRGTDFFRMDYHELNSKVIGDKPVILDSTILDQSQYVSKHIAYSTHTGMKLQQYGRLIRILELDKQSLAYLAGLREDDLIRSINGVYPAHLLHAWKLLQSGKIIEVETIKNGLKKLTKVQSRFYPMKSIAIRNDGGNMITEIKSLHSSIIDEYHSLKIKLRQNDTVIIDIRNTIGLGDLQAVLKMANTFIPDETEILKLTVGTSVHTFTSSIKRNFSYPTIRVLIDTNTEGHTLLFAGLLFHYANAELSGTRSSINGKLTLLMPLQKSPPYYLSIPIVNYEIGEQFVLHQRGLVPGKLNDQSSEYTLK
jgi:C-terminal processing protease CtpA/Prc